MLAHPSPMRTGEAREEMQQSSSSYTGIHFYGMKGYVCLVLKFALPPFSHPLPSGVQISKQNRHRTSHTRTSFFGNFKTHFVGIPGNYVEARFLKFRMPAQGNCFPGACILYNTFSWPSEAISGLRDVLLRIRNALIHSTYDISYSHFCPLRSRLAKKFACRREIHAAASKESCCSEQEGEEAYVARSRSIHSVHFCFVSIIHVRAPVTNMRHDASILSAYL